jgi:hypothetical protein
VREGWFVAGRKVPVVFFHDWGFGGFPWMRIPPSERELWMRTRGAEIYAAGGFFAFPLLGPFNNDAMRDGTIREVARQSVFYLRHKHLYLQARPLDIEAIQTEDSLLSTALWIRQHPPALIIHVVNRQVHEGRLVKRQNIALTVPVQVPPRRVAAFTPDGNPPHIRVERTPQGIRVHLSELEAYCVILLEYDRFPLWCAGYAPRIVPTPRWERAPRSEFVVAPGGLVEEDWQMVSFLQGTLHQHLRQPPTFQLDAPQGATLKVHVRAVAQLGAKLVMLVDGKRTHSIDLPDLDGKNDGTASEYDRTFSFPVPAGKHRVTLDNQGGDWASLEWLTWEGEFR